ncbi:hypothetical protein GGF32_006354, partial [Allomyces javanicus]
VKLTVSLPFEEDVKALFVTLDIVMPPFVQELYLSLIASEEDTIAIVKSIPSTVCLAMLKICGFKKDKNGVADLTQALPRRTMKRLKLDFMVADILSDEIAEHVLKRNEWKATSTGKKGASVKAPDKALKVVAKPSHASFKKARTAAPPPRAAIASKAHTTAAASAAAAALIVQKRDGDLNLVQLTPLSDFLVAVQVFRHLLDPTALVAFLQPRYPNVPLCVENLQMLFRLPRDMTRPIDLHLLPTHLDMLRRVKLHHGSNARYRVFIYARLEQVAAYRSDHDDLATLVPWLRGSYTVITVPTRLDDPFQRVPTDRTFASAIAQDAAVLFPDQVPEPPGALAIHPYSDSKAGTETIDYTMAWQLMVEEEHPPAAAIVMGTFAVGLRNLTATLHHRGNMCALRAADVDELLMLHTWVSMWCTW